MNRLRAYAAAAALALLASSWEQAAAQEPPPPDPVGADVLDYTQNRGGLMTVPVTINGSGPYGFFVDTGSERTVISRELAKALALDAGPRARMHTLAGSSHVSTVMIPALKLSRRTVRKIAAPALSRANIGGLGILGIDTLKSQQVVFDFLASEMTLSPSPSADVRSSDEIVITAHTRLGRLVLADAKAHGTPILIILDTGAEVSIGNDALRRRLAKSKKLGETSPITLISVTGAEIKADYTSIDRVTIGEIRLSDMPVAFGKVRLFDELKLTDRPAILLGMDVLRHFDRVAIDFGKRRVRFVLPKRYASRALSY